MDYRERAALALFACRVTTMIIAFVFAMHAVEATVIASILTQIILTMLLVVRSPVDFAALRKPWAAPLSAYLLLCDADRREDFESMFRGWERNGGSFLMMMTFIFYWNIESYTGVVLATAVANGVVMALVFLRVRYALRDTAR